MLFRAAVFYIPRAGYAQGTERYGTTIRSNSIIPWLHISEPSRGKRRSFASQWFNKFQRASNCRGKQGHAIANCRIGGIAYFEPMLTEKSILVTGMTDFGGGVAGVPINE